MDTADTNTALDTDSDVTLFTPAWAPRVSDDVVWDIAFSVVTNSNDGVVGGGSARVVIDDTSSVGLPGVGLNGDGDWLLVQGTLEGIRVPRVDGGVAGDLAISGESRGLAGSVSSLVRIVLLGGETANLDDIFEGIVLETTVATLISV